MSVHDHHAALIAGLPERPFVNTNVGGQEGSVKTVGTLRLGLGGDPFPVIVDRGNTGLSTVLVAGSFLGAGRVVAFSGQDFLGSAERATLLGHAHIDRLLANAIGWTTRGRATPPRVLADNERIADTLDRQGLRRVDVVENRKGTSDRDWSANALEGVDVVVAQVNEWGTARLAGASVPLLREFIERGGGLVIAGSALHWNWWITGDRGPFAGNALLRGTGISWSRDSVDDIQLASTRIDVHGLTPSVVWELYLDGGHLDLSQKSLLAPLFNDALGLGRCDELDSAISRLMSETPPLPASADSPDAILASEVASSLGPYEWPATHPWAATFPGLPEPGAQRAHGSVVVDTDWGDCPADARRDERHFPLEFYAPPGGLVTVSVPPSHATGDLAIQVGHEHDDLRPLRDQHPEWRRAPALRRTFKVTDAETAVTNAQGGSLALVVPGSYRGTIPVTVRGAIPMAVYTAGESDVTEWHAALKAGASQAIIQKPGGIRFVISAGRARGVTDPEQVSAFWDGFRCHHSELAGEPFRRAYESTWIFDPQVGYGYANSRPLTINFPHHAEQWVLVPAIEEGRAWIAALPREGPKPHAFPPPQPYYPAQHGVDWWLFGHELGHQWQTEDWGKGSTSQEIGEVAVNLFTMYTLNKYVFGGSDSTMIFSHPEVPSSVDHAALAKLRWPTSDYAERLSVYRQLIAEFGWDPIKRVFHSYYQSDCPRSTPRQRTGRFRDPVQCYGAARSGRLLPALGVSVVRISRGSHPHPRIRGMAAARMASRFTPVSAVGSVARPR